MYLLTYFLGAYNYTGKLYVHPLWKSAMSFLVGWGRCEWLSAVADPGLANGGRQGRVQPNNFSDFESQIVEF